MGINQWFRGVTFAREILFADGSEQVTAPIIHQAIVTLTDDQIKALPSAVILNLHTGRFE